jgi:hypothetical protein
LNCDEERLFDALMELSEEDRRILDEFKAKLRDRLAEQLGLDSSEKTSEALYSFAMNWLVEVLLRGSDKHRHIL